MSAAASYADIERAREALHWISPDLSRDDWVAVGMSAKAAGLDLEDFDGWSAGGQTYSTAATKAAWRSFKAGGGRGPGTLFHFARENGWRDTAVRLAPTPEALAAAAQRRADSEAREADEKAAEEACAAERALAAWNAAAPATEHPYLTRKGIQPHGTRFAPVWVKEWTDSSTGEVRRKQYADALLVPIWLAPGKLASLQAIFASKCIGRKPRPGERDERRDKDYLKDGRKSGGYASLGIVGAKTKTVVVCEGFATGGSIHEATKLPVLVAFDAGNVAAVAVAVRAKLPNVRIILAADNDTGTPGNPGLKAARAAAVLVDGLVALPPIAPGDFNDLALVQGGAAVAMAIERATPVQVAPSAPEPEPAANDNDDPRLSLPAFTALAGLPRIELVGREVSWWTRLSAQTEPQQVAAVAWAICLKRASAIPAKTSLDALIAQVEKIAGPALHPRTVEAMRSVLARWVDHRRHKALSQVMVSPDVLDRHCHEIHAELPTMSADDYHGVILVWAPMGSGKTQRIGAPFAAYAKGMDTFVATCHRRSLVSELSSRLRATHYGDVDRETAWAVDSLATCLPSITKAGHTQIIDGCKYLFIDEIAQVLRFLESDRACRTDDGTNADVHERLRTMVRNAECVIGADAGMDDRVIRFLEDCRPGERFRIIEVPSAQSEPLTVHHGHGDEAIASVYGEMQARLANGERLWIGCESEKRVAEVAKLLQSSGKRILTLTASNKGDAAQARFWDKPEAVSAQYDAVVHSPVISSGLSIEHRVEGRHFHHGFFIGGGHAIAPADAAQMMRRVRYLRTWSVAFVANNLRGPDDPEAMLVGMTAAATAEGCATAEASTFDAYVAGVRADNNAARGDFAAGMMWVLERAGFTLAPLLAGDDDEADAEILSQLREELTAERRAAILAAAELDDDQARHLRSAEHRTQLQSDALTKHAVRKALGLAVGEVDEEALDVWDDGRGPRRLDRFSAMQGLAGRDVAGEHLTHRRFHKARALAYRTLFEGLTVAPGLRIDSAMAELLVRRVIERRHMLAWLGIVPGRYGAAAVRDKAGEDLPFPMPKTPQKDVGEIFRAMGLKLGRRRNRHADNAAYDLEEESFQQTSECAKQRNSPTWTCTLIQGTPPSGTARTFPADLKRSPTIVGISIGRIQARPSMQLLFRRLPTPTPTLNIRHIRVAA